MNALDKAFIRAYSKGAAGTSVPAAPQQNEAGAQRAAAASQNRAAAEVARVSPLVEVFAADGVWYRIEQPTDEGSAVPSPAALSPPHPVPRAPRPVVQSDLSATEALDSFLGLHAHPHVPVFEQPPTMVARVDAPPRDEAPPMPATANRAATLERHELDAFIQGAAASVTAEWWEVGLNADAAPEALCQCCLAAEGVAAPLVIEQMWVEVRPPQSPAAAPAVETTVTSIETTTPMTPAPPVNETPVPQMESATSKPEAIQPPAASKEVAPAPIVATPTASAPVAPTFDLAVKQAATTTSATSVAPPTQEPAPSCSPPKPGFETKSTANSQLAPPTPVTSTPPAEPLPGKSQPAAFQAVWEVDRLTWPDECDRLARGDAFGPVAKTLVESYRRGKKIVAITGLGRGEGRTTLALCLARRVAKEGVSVAILDADFERPHLGRRVGIDIENGWDDVLTDGQPLAEAAVASLEDNLTVLPLGRRAAALVSAHTVAALQQASASFDLVLVDMGPVNDDDQVEPPGDSSSPVAALVVADRRHATEEGLTKTIDRLHTSGIETIGVVETFV